MARSTSLLAFLAVTLSSYGARAQSNAADKLLAQTLFRDGRALMTAGKTAEACAKLAESDRLDPEIGTHLNLALCHEQLGRTATAWLELGEVADRADAKHDEQRAAFARKRAASLESKLSRVRIHVVAPASDEKLTIDGIVMGRAAWDTPVPLDPGPHSIRVQAPGKRDHDQRFDLPVGPTSLDVNVDSLSDAAPPGAAVVLTPAPEPVHGTVALRQNPLRTAGFVLGGLGLMGVAVGSIFGGLAVADNDTANANCTYPGGTCNSAGVSAGSDAFTAATASTVAFIAAAACLAAGVVFMVLGTPANHQAARVDVTPSIGGMLLRGSF